MITVENIIWEGNPGMDGWYEIYVKNFNKRESIQPGFQVEFVSPLGYFIYKYPDDVKNGEKIKVCGFKIINGEIIDIEHYIEPRMNTNNSIKSGKWYPVNLLWKFPFDGGGFFTYIVRCNRIRTRRR